MGWIYQVVDDCILIVINLVVWSYYNIVIVDVFVQLGVFCIEVYIFNIVVWEEFCYYSVVLVYVIGMIVGLGLKGYELVLFWLVID